MGGGDPDRRATTLQGSVAIAATFTLAAGTLVAGTDKVGSHAWRIAFAAAFAVVVVAFAIAGVAALQATSKIHKWEHPDDEAEFARRASMSLADTQIARAAEVLRAYGANEALAEWKIERASRAADCFRWALVLLIGLALLFIVYVILG